MPPTSSTRLGVAWGALTVAFALHVWDEAAHDFLRMYNPVAAAIRSRLGGLPFPPVFSFRIWLLSLVIALVLLAALTPFVRRGGRWVLPAAYSYGTVHVLNAVGHLAVSVAAGRLAPGVLSAPVLLVAAIWLLREGERLRRERAGTVAAPAL